MRNPNSTTTTITGYTDKTIITFQYNSASVAKHDLADTKNQYATASSVVLDGKTITVTIPVVRIPYNPVR